MPQFDVVARADVSESELMAKGTGSSTSTDNSVGTRQDGVGDLTRIEIPDRVGVRIALLVAEEI